jgi:ubiquinone/menaquinone biosynthesis C-methylase UbiE
MKFRRSSPPRSSTPPRGDEARYSNELATFRDVVNVHDLPAIYHVWSNRFVAPKLAALGFAGIDAIWVDAARTVQDNVGRPLRVVSLGSGNCDVEVELLASLRAAGISVASFECLELNVEMLDRGRAHAAERGFRECMQFVAADLNQWEPAQDYEIVFANHSLHHVVELERLFDGVRRCIGESGRFLVNDMIGRNGHQRWPEALMLVHGVWARMPDRYKFNHQLQRHEDLYENWDCSSEGFEGIRAQDILPLMMERFGFDVFVPFANVIDVFVDRGFGHNFDPTNPDDLDFIARVGELDELAIDLGVVTPTHLLAVACGQRTDRTRQYRHWSPEHCLRRWPGEQLPAG